MRTISQLELEQKTAEYIDFVREHFIATNTDNYANSDMAIRLDHNSRRITLKYEGSK